MGRGRHGAQGHAASVRDPAPSNAENSGDTALMANGSTRGRTRQTREDGTAGATGVLVRPAKRPQRVTRRRRGGAGDGRSGGHRANTQACLVGWPGMVTRKIYVVCSTDPLSGPQEGWRYVAVRGHGAAGERRRIRRRRRLGASVTLRAAALRRHRRPFTDTTPRSDGSKGGVSHRSRGVPRQK